MSWTTLQSQAEALGLEIALRMKTGGAGCEPEFDDASEGWLLIGGYERMAGLWVRPRTEAARHMSSRRITSLMAESDPFVESLQDFDAEYWAACGPALAYARNLAEERLLS